jgi:DNA polymerase-3 subunit delta
MIIKNFEINNHINSEKNFFLFYGINSGFIDETINKYFKPNYLENIVIYDETDAISNENLIKESVFNKSLFDEKKLIIINRVTDKIFFLIKELFENNVKDTKILLRSNKLEKKSKLRNFFEKEKNLIICAFYEDNYQSLLSIVQKTLKEKKINISNKSIDLIIERSNGNRINIKNELGKIELYAKNNKEISLENIIKLTNLGKNYDISELVDQNLLKNKKKTIKILNENNLNIEENILILKTYLNKLKRLKKLKNDLKKNKNVDQVLSSTRPPIFWKDLILIKQQLGTWSIAEIKILINKINDLELIIKKNNQISDWLLNNFILESLLTANNTA